VPYFARIVSKNFFCFRSNKIRKNRTFFAMYDMRAQPRLVVRLRTASNCACSLFNRTEILYAYCVREYAPRKRIPASPRATGSRAMSENWIRKGSWWRQRKRKICHDSRFDICTTLVSVFCSRRFHRVFVSLIGLNLPESSKKKIFIFSTNNNNPTLLGR